MFICESCYKEFKMKSGLATHQKTCSTKEEKNDNQKQIDTLMEKWKCYPDAEYRHSIEKQIAKLRS